MFTRLAPSAEYTTVTEELDLDLRHVIGVQLIVAALNGRAQVTILLTSGMRIERMFNDPKSARDERNRLITEIKEARKNLLGSYN